MEVHIAQFVAIDNINARDLSLRPAPTTIIIILSPTTNEVEATYYVSGIIVPIIMNLFCLILWNFMTLNSSNQNFKTCLNQSQ